MSNREQRRTHRTSRKEVLAAALIMLALLLAFPGRAGAIARGTDAPEGKWPFAVKIIDIDIPTAGGGTRDSSCSGSLVSPRWVLTAGHCFRDTKNKHVSRTVAKKTLAVINRADLTGDGGHQLNIIAVKQAKVADVALAKLDKPVFDVKPIKLSTKPPKVGTTVRLTGYGFVNAKTKKLPTHMQTGTFEVDSISKTEIGVTGKSPKASTSACEHDSGGPYFTEAADGTATAIGVVSHGPTCPHTSPDAAGRIDNVRPWILSIIGKDLLTKPKPSPSPSAAIPSADTLAAPGPSQNAGFTMPKAAWLAVPVGGVALLGGLIAILRRSSRSRARSNGSRHR